ncbi:MAG: FG-GAP-like repeat-containing protein [Candidatus Thermoplasmatota archaeon]|nr:FG-GAP-like repeat-containing protein [Candidatus Thermoplasmatota archaeon]
MRITTITALFLVFCLGVQLNYDPPRAEWPGPDQVPARGENVTHISLGGTELVYDAASTTIIGEPFEREGGAFGSYTWIGDINADGINDILIAAPRSPGAKGHSDDGKVYIYYGGREDLNGNVDITEIEPDVTIIANSDPDARAGLAITSGVTVGDYNGDGYTDIAMSIPIVSFGSHGMILFGREEGWPSTIWITQTTAVSDSGPLSTYRLFDCSPAPTAMDNPMPFFMRTADIDKDGYDDLVYGGVIEDRLGFNPRKWNAVIAWGGSRYIDENEPHRPEIRLTKLLDLDDLSNYGNTLDIGDIDGDGWLDMAVGAPLRSHPSIYECGSLHLYFNISRFRNISSEPFDENQTSVIWGSGARDRFGSSVVLEDVNGDGKADIICSAPTADGPGDSYFDCGQIFIFHGGPKERFPRVMDAERDLDMMIHGPSFAVNSKGDGFKVGQMFRVGDVTGDGRPDIVLGIPVRDLPPVEYNLLRLKAGVVMVFEHSQTFGQSSRIIGLPYPSKLFTLEALDIEDVLGFHLSLGDLDGNGVLDIVVGAPSADGILNERPRAGEVHIIHSSHMRLWDLSVSGTAYENGYVFAGSGSLNMDIILFNELQGHPVTGGKVRLGSAEDTIELHHIVGGDTALTDPYGSILDHSMDLTFPQGGRAGIMRVSLDIGWFFPLRGGIDLVVTMWDSEGCRVQRTYRNPFKFVKDLSFGEGLDLSSNGRALPGPGSWVGLGDEVSFGGIEVVYTGHPDHTVPLGDITLTVRREGEDERTIAYAPDWSIDDVIDISPVQVWDLDIGLSSELFPPDQELYPAMEKGRMLRMRVDDVPPPSSNITDLFNVQGGGDGIGAPGEWSLGVDGSFTPEWDRGGSGVKMFLIEAEGKTKEIMRSPGGLRGSYYLDMDFYEQGLNVVDGPLDFEWGVWGPYPEEHIIPPYGFSARWHGWVHFSHQGPYKFQLSGRGRGAMVLGGELIIPYTELGTSPRTELLELEQGSLIEVELYYIHADPERTPSFKFLWFDEEGSIKPVRQESLFHASDHTVTEFISSGELEVVSVDWVGLLSEPTTLHIALDGDPPAIDTSSFPTWVNDTRPTLIFGIEDLGIPDGSGSGLDLAGFSYRILRSGETYGTWVSDDIIFDDMVTLEGKVSSLDAVIRPRLDRDFSGTFELISRDSSGNTARTPALRLSVDMKGPEVLLISPDPRNILTGGDLTATIRVLDQRGSGVDGTSAMFRIRFENGDWGPWTTISGEGNAPDIYLEAPLNLMEGRHEVQFSASDMVGNRGLSQPILFEVRIPPVNMPPVPHISSPEHGFRTIEGWPVILDATGTRDDGLGLYDPVKVTWYSNRSGYLGSGFRLSVYLPLGPHTITLFADDGTPGHNVSTSVNMTILRPSGDDPVPNGEGRPEDDATLIGALMLAFFSILLFLGILVLLLLIRRKHSAKEFGYGLRTRSIDDEFLDEM